jgi:hypothetical protein
MKSLLVLSCCQLESRKESVWEWFLGDRDCRSKREERKDQKWFHSGERPFNFDRTDNTGVTTKSSLTLQNAVIEVAQGGEVLIAQPNLIVTYLKLNRLRLRQPLEDVVGDGCL